MTHLTTTPPFNYTLLSTTVGPTNKTSEVAVLAHKAFAYVTGSTTGIIVGVLILIILIVLVVILLKKAVSGLKEAKERALLKLKDLRRSHEQALDMAEAVPDISVSTVQPSGSRRKLHNLGNISFSIRYEDDENDFVVKVHKATDLPLKYTGGTVYKYVEIEMFPYHRMSATKPKTSYLRNALDPEWEEDVRIKMTREEVGDQDMYVHVCDFNQISSRDLIGSFKVDFDDVKLKSGGKETEFNGALKWIEGVRGAERGDICIVLRYYRGEGQLLVTVKEIKGLRPFIGRRYTSAYVKVHVVHGNKELDERKTKVKRKNFEPTYNEKFQFDIPASIIEQVNLIIRVKDKPWVGTKALLGEACIGGDAVGTYFHHWRLVLEKEQEIEMWHCLESLNIVPGKTNLATAMKAIPVLESSESEEEPEEEGGLLDFMPDILPDIEVPSLGGLFGSSKEEEAEKNRKEEEEKKLEKEETEVESGKRKKSVSL